MTVLETVGDEWVDFLVADLGTPPRALEIAEILSDTGAELYLNALTARNLRAFGRAHRGPHFWVRSEWADTDISYGEARSTFDLWDTAWSTGVTGDLGQIEAKVLYSHFTRAQRLERLEKVVSQLGARRKADHHFRGPDHAAAQRYHGIVWLFDHGTDAVAPEIATERISLAQTAIEGEARALELRPVAASSGSPFRPVLVENLGDLWPNVRGNYVGRLFFAIFHLP